MFFVSKQAKIIESGVTNRKKMMIFTFFKFFDKNQSFSTMALKTFCNLKK